MLNPAEQQRYRTGRAAPDRGRRTLAIRRRRAAHAGPEPGPDRGGYQAALKRLIDGSRFPAPTAAVEAGAFDSRPHPGVEFGTGLGHLLDGIEVSMVGQRD